MLVEAIANQAFDTDHLIIEKGEIITGVCRGYKQDTILVDDLKELDDEPYFKDIVTRVRVVKNSIKRLICVCNNYATRTINGEHLCNDCEWESAETHELDIWNNETDRGWG